MKFDEGWMELMEKPFHSFLSPQGFRTLTRQTVPKSPAFTLYSPAKYDDDDDESDDGDDGNDGDHDDDGNDKNNDQ